MARAHRDFVGGALAQERLHEREERGEEGGHVDHARAADQLRVHVLGPPTRTRVGVLEQQQKYVASPTLAKAKLKSRMPTYVEKN